MTAPIRTLLPMAADGVGPSFTCTRLVGGMQQAGAPVTLAVNRARPSMREIARMQVLLPPPLSRLPYRYVSEPASRLLERRYLARLAPGDIAWLWPSVSLETHEAVHARGNPIVLEGINTRMARAKDVLDAAYDAIDAPPAHGITDERVAEEEAKIACAETIFAPSHGVEEALEGSPLEDRFIASSYGVDTAQTLPEPDRGPQPDTVTFLFCGYLCVRKGGHHLLDIWPRMPANARLRIVGRIEPLIAERYGDLLNSERVEPVGFTRDVAPHYAQADVFVFPSLEEGDPLVTYEAALHSLPVVASRPGAGRIGAQTGCARIIEPQDSESFLETMLELHRDRELRLHLGRQIRTHLEPYDWNRVAERRLADLERWRGGAQA